MRDGASPRSDISLLSRRLAFGATLIAILVGLLGAGSAWAQRDWNRLDDPMTGSVGLHVGKIGGMGLAGKYPLKWWLYFQLAGGIWHTSDDKRHNVGMQLQYILRQDHRLRLYTTIGTGFFYHKNVHGNKPDEVSEAWNSGFGIGIEFLRGERFSIQIEGDFTHESDDDDILFLPQVGIYYYY